jgi:hypothetical protein
MSQLYDANGNPFLTDVVVSGTPGALAATVSATLRGQACATVQVTAIGLLTLTFEGSTDGINFDPVFATPIAGGTPVSTTTANGHWVNINTTALAIFRVRVSAYTSGSAVVSVIVSQGSPISSFTTSGASKIDLASENGTALGTPTNFGTTPGAVAVLGANASLFQGTVAIAAATPLSVRVTDGTTQTSVIAATAALKIDTSSVAGTATVTSAAGVQKVGISGAAGTTLDAGTAGVLDTNLKNVANTALGVPQTFGTPPTGVVLGASADVYIAGTRARSGQATLAAGILDVNIVGVVGTTWVNNGPAAGSFVVTGNSTPGATVSNFSLTVGGWDGAHTQSFSTDTTGRMRANIAGAAAATLDAVVTAAAAPANGLAVLVENVTTAPSLTTGQSVMAQADYQGSLFVKPYRRGQTVAKATTISATGATSILAAQAAGIFADIANLIISVTPQATTASSFTATLSDGTASYIFDLIAEVTVAAGTNPLVLLFNPPLAATSAATAWTLNLSVTNTVHVTVNAVLQKAS